MLVQGYLLPGPTVACSCPRVISVLLQAPTCCRICCLCAVCQRGCETCTAASDRSVGVLITPYYSSQLEGDTQKPAPATDRSLPSKKPDPQTCMQQPYLHHLWRL